jgi:transposase
MTLPKEDADPKAVACYGILRADMQEVLVRFVDGRPVSHVTTAFLTWVGALLKADGKKALLLVWDNASWHVSKEVRSWVRAHNRQAKREGGVRILLCQLPVKSPWLNRIEPKWVHAKRAVAEPDRLLSKAELIGRICSYFTCKYVEHLKQAIAKRSREPALVAPSTSRWSSARSALVKNQGSCASQVGAYCRNRSR